MGTYVKISLQLCLRDSSIGHLTLDWSTYLIYTHFILEVLFLVHKAFKTKSNFPPIKHVLFEACTYSMFFAVFYSEMFGLSSSLGLCVSNILILFFLQ